MRRVRNVATLPKLFLLTAVVFWSGCTPPEERARRELERNNIPLTIDDFVTAASHGDVQSVSLFLQAGMKPDEPDFNGSTPLMMAAELGHAEVLEVLLPHGANPNVQGKDGYTALMNASAKNQPEAVRVLLEHKADPTLADEKGWTAFMRSVYQGNEEVLAALLPASRSQFPQAISVAALIGNQAIVKALIAGGASVNSAIEGGQTPLMFAAAKGNEEMVRFLLARGANPLNANSKGVTAAQIATAKGYSRVARLIEDAEGGKIPKEPPPPPPAAKAVKSEPAKKAEQPSAVQSAPPPPAVTSRDTPAPPSSKTPPAMEQPPSPPPPPVTSSLSKAAPAPGPTPVAPMEVAKADPKAGPLGVGVTSLPSVPGKPSQPEPKPAPPTTPPPEPGPTPVSPPTKPLPSEPMNLAAETVTEGGTAAPRDERPYYERLRLKEFSESRLPLELREVDDSGAEIEIAGAGGKTSYVERGERIGGTSFRLTRVQPRHITDKGGQVVDASQAWVEDVANGEEFRLVRGMTSRSSQSHAVLEIEGEARPVTVRQGEEFLLPGDPTSRYKVLDLRSDQVVIRELNGGETFTVTK